MAVGQRYKTGETSPSDGAFLFDGYTDGTSTPAPSQEERMISLQKNETFPPIKSARKACWWKQVR